jgi:hypothetical protein
VAGTVRVKRGGRLTARLGANVTSFRCLERARKMLYDVRKSCGVMMLLGTRAEQ